MERRRFTAEFKRGAVKLARQDGVWRAKVAQEPGLHVTMLTRRVREAQAGKCEMAPGRALKTEQQQELERLLRELKRVTTERDILNGESATVFTGRHD